MFWRGQTTIWGLCSGGKQGITSFQGVMERDGNYSWTFDKAQACLDLFAGGEVSMGLEVSDCLS